MRRILLLLAAGATLALTGCTSAGPAPAPEAGVVPAEDTCWEYTEVSTLLWNSRVGYDAGTLDEQAWRGIGLVATRLLDRIPTEPRTPLAVAIDDMREQLDGVVDDSDAVDVTDPGYVAADRAIADLCTDALGEWGTYGWYGG